MTFEISLCYELIIPKGKILPEFIPVHLPEYFAKVNFLLNRAHVNILLSLRSYYFLISFGLQLRSTHITLFTIHYTKQSGSNIFRAILKPF